MFTKAIVRKPAISMIHGITTADLGKPEISLARDQHSAYIEALKQCGLEVIVLEADEAHPDSVFVEDTAVVTDRMAIITNPAPESRKGEIREIKDLLLSQQANLSFIEPPGTIEGGDVMQVENKFYIGLSERTSQSGADQLIQLLTRHNYTGIAVPMKELLHLKTGISYLGDNAIVVFGELTREPLFAGYRQIVIDKEESYAANCIRVNDFVLIPEGYPRAKSSIEAAGFKTIPLEMSEFRKLDGGLSCLSLRF